MVLLQHCMTITPSGTNHADYNSLVETLIELGNPFEDCCDELVVLHSRHIVNCTIAEVASVREVGRTQYGDIVY